MRRVFFDIYTATRYSSREEMWISEIKSFTNDKSFQYIEFGVWQGSSIKCIAHEFKNPKNRFFGFDSFEGLPETWFTMTGSRGPGQ